MNHSPRDDEAAVYKERCQAVEEWIAVFEQDGAPLTGSTAGKQYSGKFVVRVGQDLHKALAIGIMRRGESLNEHGARLLCEDKFPYGERDRKKPRSRS